MHSEKCQGMVPHEFGRLKDMCYLDHAGATLYAESQIKSSAQDLCENVYGNPHSLSLCSRQSSDVIDQIRLRVLQHFHTNPVEYSVIFTSGTTEALKVVAETFRFNDRLCSEGNDTFSGEFVYLQDNHTSVLGMREVAAKNGANIRYISHQEAFKMLSDKPTNHDLRTNESNLKQHSLFVYPAQCNFSGVKYPLEWIHRVQNGMLDIHNSGSRWFCLLDAAAFVSTNLLDLSEVKPDFVSISFYKIFGYPTGLGALLVKNSSTCVLEKCYFGGGTVQISLSRQRFHVYRESLSERFEDGTLPFLSIIALRHGFEALERLGGSMCHIAEHTFSLAQHLFQFLVTAHHSNGSPAAVLYSDTDYSSVVTQGNIVNFNMLRPTGEYVGFVEVLNMANLHDIQLRTGCFCNPGACQRHLRLSDEQLKEHFQAGHTCGDERDLINGQPTGSIRVSFGYMTTKQDVDKLIHMLCDCFVEGAPVHKLPQWWTSFQHEFRTKFHVGTTISTTSEECSVMPHGCAEQTLNSSSSEECSATPHGCAEQTLNSTASEECSVMPHGCAEQTLNSSSSEECSVTPHGCAEQTLNSTTSEECSVMPHGCAEQTLNSTASEECSVMLHGCAEQTLNSSSSEECSVMPHGCAEQTLNSTTSEECSVTPHGCVEEDVEVYEDCCSEQAVGMLVHMFVYPVKSCGAVAVQDWLIGPRGFLYDREWMVVTAAGVSLTQKQEVKLCLLRPGFDLKRAALTLDYPGMPQTCVALATPGKCHHTLDASLCQSKVCGDRVQGWDCGSEVAQWLTQALGRTGLRLIRQWDSDSRVIKNRTASKAKSGLSLSNQAQFLLLNNSSIQWLANKIQDDSACNKEGLVRRFRSNLVVKGNIAAFAENDWKHIQIGTAHFQSEGACTRCQMVCIDQDTAERSREPLRTIAAQFHGKMRFGIYLSHRSTGGEPVTIAVGDTVSCL